MASINIAINYVLHQEDPELSGVVTDNKSDIGGRTRFGVAERYHPDLTKSGFYDSMGYSDALEVADQVYKDQYANPLQILGLNNQQVANALLSFAINLGVTRTIKMAQDVVQVLDDGVLGPISIAAINIDSGFLTSLHVLVAQYYMRVVAANPSQHVFIRGWLNRAQQNCETAIA